MSICPINSPTYQEDPTENLPSSVVTAVRAAMRLARTQPETWTLETNKKKKNGFLEGDLFVMVLFVKQPWKGMMFVVFSRCRKQIQENEMVLLETSS